jgi:hypothetical protein
MKTEFATPNQRRKAAGFSIPEAVIAIGIGALAVAGGMAINQEQLRMVKSTRESNGASLALEERVEQLRLASWRQITNSDYLKATYFSGKPKSSKPLAGMTEHVTITAFPNAAACTPLEVERNPDGSTRILQSGSGLSDQRLAKVDVGLTWTGKDGRRRTRELATVISNAGISRMNLPALGAGFAGTATSTPATTDTTSSTGTSGTADTGTTDTTGSTTTTTTTGNGNDNGNGNGRGNVSGKPGKA